MTRPLPILFPSFDAAVKYYRDVGSVSPVETVIRKIVNGEVQIQDMTEPEEERT